MKKQDYEKVDRITVDASDDLETVSSFNSLNMARYMVLPKRKIYCIAIRGPLNQVAPKELIRMVESNKIVILSGIFALDDSNPHIANILAFVDVTDSLIQPEELTKQFHS